MRPEDSASVARLRATARYRKVVVLAAAFVGLLALAWLMSGFEWPALPQWFLPVYASGFLAWGISSRLLDHGTLRDPVVTLQRGPSDIWRAVLGFLMLVLGLLGTWRYLQGRGSPSNVFGVPFGIFFLVSGVDRPKLLDEGLWQDWNLLRWSKIRGYRWEDRSPSHWVLHLEVASWMVPYRKLFVPSDRQVAVARLLEERVGASKGGKEDAAT